MADAIVARQIRTASVNEVSGRYTEEYYVPSEFRGQDSGNKQGSSGVVPVSTLMLRGSCVSSFEAYKTLLAEGVSKEQARLALPYTEWVWKIDLRHFFELPHAQAETKAYAIVRPLLPWTFEDFVMGALTLEVEGWLGLREWENKKGRLA